MPLPRKLKILLINAYDMEEHYEMYRKGLIPGHHLFGAPELASDYNMEIIIPKQVKYSFLNTIGNLFDIALLDQQIRAMIALRKCDILYAPYAAADTKLILLAKLFGFIRKPIVILVHNPLFGKPSKYKWKRKLVRKLILTYDTIILLCQRMRTELIDAYDIDPVHAEKHLLLSHWGADMEFFEKFSTPNTPATKNFLISSGKSRRDFDLLIGAAAKIDFPFKIYCTPICFPKTKPIPKNVELLSGDFPFEQICRDYADARIILIPLSSDPEGTVGFTSLMDAMGMSKPAIMSENKNIDIDFDREKIGMIVNVNDVDGWVHAISQLLDNYSLLKEMGENCHRLGMGTFHLSNFVRDLAKALSDTYQHHISK